VGKGASKTAQRVGVEAANRYSQLGTQFAAESAPARQLAQQTYTNIVRGGPEAYRSIAPQVDFAKQQFANARRTLAQTTPAGGASAAGNRALAGTEAQTISNLYRDKLNEALAGLTQSGQFGTQAGLGALGGQAGVAQTLAGLGASQSEAWAQGLGGLAGAIGTFFGLRHK